jgi:hypothetical protein
MAIRLIYVGSPEHAKKLPRRCASEGALEMPSNSFRRKKR